MPAWPASLGPSQARRTGGGRPGRPADRGGPGAWAGSRWAALAAASPGRRRRRVAAGPGPGRARAAGRWQPGNRPGPDLNLGRALSRARRRVRAERRPAEHLAKGAQRGRVVAEPVPERPALAIGAIGIEVGHSLDLRVEFGERASGEQ